MDPRNWNPFYELLQRDRMNRLIKPDQSEAESATEATGTVPDVRDEADRLIIEVELPVDAQIEAARASFDDGILRVEIPRRR